ncbi:glycosyltransferase [Butyrivibrio sp. AD3002]|uniref:glycosyltransferase n=1 Tax=Butyrivibrio sp. AD3002 TaxID=1280670 RepID=UPI0003B58775|nr:glycosyltransferase [Butyrivibrio sp. AD3002]
MSKVSICIPVFNGEDTIRDTIQSALNQTYQDIEIVVIDNHSTDKTVDIVKGINDDRIVLYENETNLGMAGNWNECLKKAKGEYIHFLCADDKLRRSCVEKKMKAVESKKDIVLVTSSTDIINENDELVMRRNRFWRNVVLDGRRYAKKSLHRGNIFGEPSNIMFKRSLLEKAGEFSTNLYYVTDWEFWVRLAVFGKVAYIYEPLTKYRISMNNVTARTKLSKIMNDDDQMIKNLKESGLIDINIFDEVVHKGMLTGRNVARYLYMRMKSR